MTEAPASPTPDPAALIRSKSYRALLVMAAVLGVLVSFSSWCFLEAVYWIQQEVFHHLPSDLGFDTVPWWWPLPPLAIAGVLAAFAILKLPGGGGHIPYLGLKGGSTQPIAAPGVLLAALATLGLGVVLGPEAPLIALGSALAIFAVRSLKKDTPDQAVAVLSAAAAFAALATIFGSPVVGAVILIEAAGLGGAMLPVILLPGLMAAGIGSLIFIGMSSWTGLSSSDYALSPFTLPALSSPTFVEFLWTIVLAIVAAVVTFGVIHVAAASSGVVSRKPWVLLPATGLAIGGLAILFAALTPQPADVVLFTGQDAFTSLFSQASTLSMSTIALLILFKGAAWALSLGSFRGGPTFPALFIGAVGGLLAAHLPGFSETPAVAALMAATAVAMLKLPLSCIVITLLMTSQAGPGVAPIVIVAVVVSYVTIQILSNARPIPGSATAPAPPSPASTASTAEPASS